jgi:hypothetical protein
MAPSWNPGNVETRNILVGGVFHVHSHGRKDTSLSEISGESDILYGCTGIRRVSLIPAEFRPAIESILLASSNP